VWRVEFAARLDRLNDCLKSSSIARGAIIFGHGRFDFRVLHKFFPWYGGIGETQFANGVIFGGFIDLTWSRLTSHAEIRVLRPSPLSLRSSYAGHASSIGLAWLRHA
jgi:hypothetical protein